MISSVFSLIMMESYRNKYLAFDDTRFLLIGIPVITLFIQLIFFRAPLFPPSLSGLWEMIEGLLYTTAFWIANREMMIFLRKRFPLLDQNKRRIGYHLLFILMSTPVIGGCVTLVVIGIYYFTPLHDLSNPSYYIATFATYFICISVSLVYEVIYFFDKYKSALMERNELRVAHVQTQLDHLRSQINPHFLFNSLNTLMNLIPMDQEQAMGYLSKLSKFYRMAVNQQDERLIPLEQELNNLGVYIDLLKERFQNGFSVNYPIKNPADLQIPPMSLQLIVENAVKHNIISSKKPLTIDIAIQDQSIHVINNKQLKIRAPESSGMGLKNIAKRFSFFTDKAIDIIEKDSSFEVVLPLITHRK